MGSVPFVLVGSVWLLPALDCGLPTAVWVGMAPLLWADGTGAEVMKRIVAPMVGGLVTSTFLTLEVIPVAYVAWRAWEWRLTQSAVITSILLIPVLALTLGCAAGDDAPQPPPPGSVPLVACPSKEGVLAVLHGKVPPVAQLPATKAWSPADVAVDLSDWSCPLTSAAPLPEPATSIDERADFGGTHVALPEVITYTDSPPASGPHRGQWARWGEYAYLPPQRWLHNLEHGGVALLYDPCAPAFRVCELRALAKARAAASGGAFRWVMTPYPGLGAAVAVVTWRWRWRGTVLDLAAIDAFLTAHYRKAPEDFDFEGSYDLFWLGP
ncbi:MAG: DUF3105 domain-containing protein [Myxococcales bacterium]|nr:DUF3105 domain-containing protein [Myxococcales bacterium]